MELFEAIKTRRSIRKFSDKPVPNEILEKIIETGICAPSACDIQGWRFIIINKPYVMKKLMDKGLASFIEENNTAVLVLYDNRTDNVEYQDHIQSGAACIENMLLAIHSLGLGGCWVCNLPSKSQIRKIFNIPKIFDPIALVVIGYTESPIKSRPRKKELNDVISYNEFNLNLDVSLINNVFIKIKRIMRKSYYLIPFKKKIGFLIKRLEKKFD